MADNAAMAEGIGTAASGLFTAVGSLFGGRARRREQRRARREQRRYKNAYAGLDTSNLALGQQNMFEDLTVNQQQAKFQAEQQNQGLANILETQNTVAGGSGIASVAQALANQQSKNIAQSAISIGQQEQQNQILQQRAASQIQQQEIQGAAAARNLQYEKTGTLLGMSNERLASANKARQDATSALFGGLGDMAAGTAEIVAGAAG